MTFELSTGVKRSPTPANSGAIVLTDEELSAVAGGAAFETAVLVGVALLNIGLLVAAFSQGSGRPENPDGGAPPDGGTDDGKLDA